MKPFNADLGEMENLISGFVKVTELTDSPIDRSKIKICPRNPHSPEKLPAGKMGIYIFCYRGQCLKIGKAGAKSGARFTSHHYALGRATSNLAKSLFNDLEIRNIGNIPEIGIGEWIKNNTVRTDILLDETLSVWTLNLLEAFLHYQCRPKYEGFKSQSAKI